MNPVALFAACYESTFFGFPTWYKYVSDPIAGGGCEIKADFQLLGNDTWLVGAAVLEILLRIAAIVAFIMIIWGGYMILTSVGDPNKVSRGRQHISNALIGFIIAIMATTVVSYLTQQLGVVSDNDTANSALAFVLGLVYRVAAGVTVIIVAISGFTYVTSSGDPAKTSKARNGIIYAALGLVITLLAATIIAAIGGRL